MSEWLLSKVDLLYYYCSSDHEAADELIFIRDRVDISYVYDEHSITES